MEFMSPLTIWAFPFKENFVSNLALRQIQKQQESKVSVQVRSGSISLPSEYNLSLGSDFLSFNLFG
jgi:hypothetical protein